MQSAWSVNAHAHTHMFSLYFFHITVVSCHVRAPSVESLPSAARVGVFNLQVLQNCMNVFWFPFRCKTSLLRSYQFRLWVFVNKIEPLLHVLSHLQQFAYCTFCINAMEKGNFLDFKCVSDFLCSQITSWFLHNTKINVNIEATRKEKQFEKGKEDKDLG